MPSKWAQKLGDPICPYMTRWVLDLRLFSLRLHCFHRSDSDRHLHDHPWWFVSFILSRQGYDEFTEIVADTWSRDHATFTRTDYTEDGQTKTEAFEVTHCRPWRPHFRRAEHRHAVRLVDKRPVWTFCITGPRKRQWGFWVDKVFKASRKYFGIYGHPPCE